MEEQAAQLLATLKRPSASMDSKLQQFNTLKSGIKHQRVPDAAQPQIFECLKLSIGSQTSSTLVSTGFATIGHLIKRLTLQDQTSTIATQATKLYPILLDRLGDARENHRVAASQAFADLWPSNHGAVENTIRDGALAGNSSRAREMAMLWVVKMHKSEGLAFKSFVPYLVLSLEDADGVTRDVAKSAIVDLFRNAPDHAKADVKRQMGNKGVRKTIVNQIVAQLDSGNSDLDLGASTSTATSTSTSSAPPPAVNRLNPDRGIADSILMAPEAQPPPAETVPMDPIYVHSSREVDEVFRELSVHFEGKETEGNWMARDKGVLKLRRMNKGNASTEFANSWYAGIKGMLEGILKVANSLRTTMSTNGCQLFQEMAKTMGHALDPMVEILLQNFLKMCGATKNIAAQNGNVTVDTILTHVTFNHRIMSWVASVFDDKNVQPRKFACGWLRTIIRKHTSRQANIDHSGGTDTLEKCIKKGLGDANPQVRETMRGTYWVFAQVWPIRGTKIMDGLDPKQRGLLEKDPNNPDTSSRNAALSKSTSAMSQSRPSVKEIAAQRKAQLLAARRQPDRPTSAQATLTPARPSSSSSNSRGPSSLSHAPRPPSTAAARAAASSSTTAAGSSLMSAPVRRPRRPELARPATAEPYSVRKAAGRPETPSGSTEASPSKRSTVKKPAVPKSAARPPSRKGQPVTASPVRSKSRLGQAASRPGTGHASKPSVDTPGSTPVKDESMTIVMPAPKVETTHDPQSAFKRRPQMEKTMSVDMGMQNMADDETFTMVIPSVKMNQTDDDSQSRHQSPAKGANAPGFNSPSQTLRSRSPLKSSEHPPPEEEVKVYEDPFDGQQPEPKAPEDRKPVLEEVPVNEAHNASEPATRDATSPSPENEKSGGSASPTPMDSTEIVRSRRLLASGTERIRAKTLDAHGFRRLQDIVKTRNDAIWASGDPLTDTADTPATPTEKRFNLLLPALLDYMEAPLDSLKAPGVATTNGSAPPVNFKAQNLKTQALATIRAMVFGHKRESAPFLPRAICSVARARAQHESNAHIAADIERTIEDLARASGNKNDCFDAVIDLLEAERLQASEGDLHARTIAAALNALSQLLKASGDGADGIGQLQTERLGKAAVRFLEDPSPDVRKADMDVCLEMHDRLGGERGGPFWKAVEGASEGHLNLIAYYVARRAKN